MSMLWEEKKLAIIATQKKFPTMIYTDVLIYVESVLGYPSY